MKKIIMTALLGATFSLATAQPIFFVHPMDFDNTEAINYSLNYFVKNECQNTDQAAQLTAFESLSHGKDRAAMDKAIKSVCDSGSEQCDYVTIQTEYLKQI
ncbi:hypothetical protein [Wohlfahrtiimonas larvae]|uniref:DUF4189 domain-containing protein n=1 Tax=Wohlfahrtiimonas larvae TaxID=1157986 RepID=A0ABP9MNM4_9GAMM|nr:hypothetical protein [Wohlfahrtiimonas larvae]